MCCSRCCSGAPSSCTRSPWCWPSRPGCSPPGSPAPCSPSPCSRCSTRASARCSVTLTPTSIRPTCTPANPRAPPRPTRSSTPTPSRPARHRRPPRVLAASNNLCPGRVFSADPSSGDWNCSSLSDTHYPVGLVDQEVTTTMANSDRGHGTGPDPADQPEHLPAPDRAPDAQASPDLPAAPPPSGDEPPVEQAPEVGQVPGQASGSGDTGPVEQPAPGAPPRRIELTVAELLGRTPLAAAGRRPTRHSVHSFEKMSPRRRVALTAGAVVAAGSVVAAALFAPNDFLRPREPSRTNSDGEPESRPPTPGAAADSRSALPTGAPSP